MRIRNVHVHAVGVPVTRAGHFSKRVVERVENTIVEIETDAGLVGLGETRGNWCTEIIRTRIAHAIAGMDALDRSAIRAACLPKEPFDYGYPEHISDRNAYAAVDIALWDLAGKAEGKPLYDLLGGGVRQHALFCGYAYSDDPHAGHSDSQLALRMAEIATQQIHKSGASLFEYKIGLHAIDCEIGIAKAVRAALGPDVDIAVDANMGMSKDQAFAFLEGARDVRLANIEEPVASLADMEEIRDRTGIPVSTHCYDADTLARYPLIDAMVIDPQLVGGITGFLGAVGGGGDAWEENMATRPLGTGCGVGRVLSFRNRVLRSRPAEPGPYRLGRGRFDRRGAVAGHGRRGLPTQRSWPRSGARPRRLGALRRDVLAVSNEGFPTP